MPEYDWKDNLKEVLKPSACFLLGITGGIASGNSTVAAMLADIGVELGHRE